ncbi:hypothetical protein C797_12306 [Bacillus thuringiensis Sbt003]|uniref:Lipoprotein n=1 Tax=Bacillus thuringiensis Sbt003 TaxID=1235825 RepID=A0A9X0F9J6_BACTU|nr:hypothetical protein C797_12306 [Bacillus thuringiensis Sbt003]
MKPILKTSIAITLFSLSLMGCQSSQAQPNQTSSLTEQQVLQMFGIKHLQKSKRYIIKDII